MFISVAFMLKLCPTDIATSGVEFQSFQCQKRVCQVCISSSKHDGGDFIYLPCWSCKQLMSGCQIMPDTKRVNKTRDHKWILFVHKTYCCLEFKLCYLKKKPEIVFN